MRCSNGSSSLNGEKFDVVDPFACCKSMVVARKHFGHRQSASKRITVDCGKSSHQHPLRPDRVPHWNKSPQLQHAFVCEAPANSDTLTSNLTNRCTRMRFRPMRSQPNGLLLHSRFHRENIYRTVAGSANAGQNRSARAKPPNSTAV